MSQELVKIILDRVTARIGKCFLCKWISEDLQANQKFTNYPGASFDGNVTFPLEGKIRHLMLEEIWTPEMKSMVSEEVMKKVKSMLESQS
jgi:hypothetical protein